MIVAICFAVVALVAGGYGLGLIAYERGKPRRLFLRGWQVLPQKR